MDEYYCLINSTYKKSQEDVRHASNPLDSFVFVQGQHRQAESPPFDACLAKLQNLVASADILINAKDDITSFLELGQKLAIQRHSWHEQKESIYKDLEKIIKDHNEEIKKYNQNHPDNVFAKIANSFDIEEEGYANALSKYE
jgi:hypothetical protein